MGNICILMILFNLLIYIHFLFYSLLFQTRYRNRIKDEVKAIANSSSIVHFYFDSLGATKYERDKLFGTLDLIGKAIWNMNDLWFSNHTKCYFSAAFGGLVGLCSGFSIISLIEIIYWFSIRIIFNGVLNKKK